MVVEFELSGAAGVGNLVAQGDSDNIGCRIIVDGEVKAERIRPGSERVYLLRAEGRMSTDQMHQEPRFAAVDSSIFAGSSSSAGWRSPSS